jgi:hypothetical protein
MKTHRSWWSEPGLVAWRSQECWARPGSPPGDRAGQRLGDGRDRHSPASERRPRPAGTGPGTSGGRPGPSRSPASGCWTTAGASWPRSTWVSCGAPSAPASPLSRADLHEVLRDGVPVRWAAPSGPWSGWMGRCRSPSTTTAVASSTWSSAPTGCAPRSGGWPWTVDHRSRSASTAGGSWPLSKRYALGARRGHRHHCAAQQVRELAGVGHRLVAETVVSGDQALR